MPAAMDKLTVRDLDAHDKRVFVRVDFNVPLEDGRVTDDSRIRASLPTILHLQSQGARIVLASHLGRPEGKVQDGLRLRPVGERLSQLLRRNVPVTGDALGPGTEDAVRRLRAGEVLLLENLRFHPEEEANDPKFAATLASYADVYVNDAFGTAHRAHASTVGVPKLLPAYAGLLMEREIQALSKLLEDPEHPFVAIVGGAKVSGKLKVLDNLVRKVDRLILGGGMANTFLLAQGRSIGKSLAEHDMVDQARRVLAEAEACGVRVLLPVDVIVAKEVTRGTEYKTLPAEKIPASWHIVDVGKQTLVLIEEALADARTVMWNGPIGVFEIPVFGTGTRHVARILADKAEAGATVVVGGGDSVAAVQQQGLASKMTHISTGGGASLEFLEGRELPGIAVLLDRPTPTPVEKPAAPKTPKVAAAQAAPRPVSAARPAPAARQPARPAKPAPVAIQSARPAKPAKPAPKAARAATKPVPAARPVMVAARPGKVAARPGKVAAKPAPKQVKPAPKQAKPAPKQAKPATQARPAAKSAKPARKQPKATPKPPKTTAKTAPKPAKATTATSQRKSAKATKVAPKRATPPKAKTTTRAKPSPTRGKARAKSSTARPTAKTTKRSTAGIKRAAATNRAKRPR
jgi:phosphoglycerate kinase